MIKFTNIVGITLLSALLVVPIAVWAHGWGMGGGWNHHGSGWHHRGHYGEYGYGPGNDLTKEEYRQLEEKRESFFRETQEIRNNLYEKQRELENELEKSEPDAAKASRLQKEISDLRAQFDQKRIDHMIEMRKLSPNIGRGFRSEGPKRGYGPYSSGHCWE
jgi:Spy/CpxP family protein refolding chaperone